MTPNRNAPVFLGTCDVSAIAGIADDLRMMAQGLLEIPGLKPSEAKCWRKVKDDLERIEGVIAHAQVEENTR